MIIKKKYTQIKKPLEDSEQKIKEIPPVPVEKKIPRQPEPDIDLKKEILPEKPPVEKQKETPEKPDDFDLNITDVQFEQREERREGSRRRGYRRTQDRNVISRAQQDALNIKEAAKTEGYNEGIAKAKEDLQEIRNKIADFFDCKEELFNKVSECILDISVEMAKKILNKEIETDNNITVNIIKGVVEEINKTEEKITLKVMPKDVELVKDNIEEIFSGKYFEAKISVVPDNTIKEGGVIVETSNGIIDASIETQLSIIENALKKQKE
ncbi:MAG: hypothetical protein LUG16_06775 [Candidatus Gastranaerophilales bacterium]|nr:hypothetical protein [Candidatus Gastranaerophilales bacterium]